jgi:hypothetical protein
MASFASGIAPGGGGGGMITRGCTKAGAIALDMTVLDPARIPVPPVPRCWIITGVKVPIGRSFASVQSGFEIVNFNFHTYGTQRSLPTNTGIKGPISV